MNKKYEMLFCTLFFLIFCANVNAEEVLIELETQKSVLDIEKEAIDAKEGVILKYGDIKIRSDTLKKIEGENIIISSGNVIFSKGQQVVKSEEVLFNLDTKEVKILNSDSYNSDLKLRFGGEKTTIEGKDKVTIINGWFTPSPYEKPNYKLNAKEIEIYPNRKLVARNIAINVKGKDIIKFPYYVTSLKSESKRATLFPFIGSNSDKGLYGIWGFDYDYKGLFEGYVDVEASQKKKISLKSSNDYILGKGNTGNISVNRFTIPFKKDNRELDISWDHKLVFTPKLDKIDRKFFDLGYGIWDFGYKNITTNLLETVDGEKLKDNYTDYISKHKKMRYYDLKIDQEIGKNGELNFEYYWTKDREALKELTKINDDIVFSKDLNPLHTDIDLFRKIKYTNGNGEILVKLDSENFFDVNPGYVGDENSYRKNHSYILDMKGPKFKLEYLDSDEDKYKVIYGMKERDDDDPYLFENRNDRWVKILDYNRKKEWSLKFGNYYPFRKNDFFGYKPKDLYTNLFSSMYFGFDTKYTEKQLKEYEYDYTRDNHLFDTFFRNDNIFDKVVYNDNRVYKIYENSEKARRMKRIVDEKYRSQKFDIGNDRVDLPFRDSYISFNYGLENRNYSTVYIPDFSGRVNSNGQRVDLGRKMEDLSSKTGYKLMYDDTGKEIKVNPKLNIHNIDFKLFTSLFDNTNIIDNKYDVKINNEIGLNKQITKAKDAMYDKYDIVEIPDNIMELRNDFNFSVGNVFFNYKILKRDNKHFEDNWLKDEKIQNYFKIDIDNKRYFSANFENEDVYEIKDTKSKKEYNSDFEYGYLSENDDNFLYKLTTNTAEYYPYNRILGWSNDNYKEKNVESVAQINYNEWGIEYSNEVVKINDLFHKTDEKGIPELKSKVKTHKVSFKYDTKKKKNKNSNIDYYIKIDLGTGDKIYRDLKGTPTFNGDDGYIYGKDYFNFGTSYRMEFDVNKEKNIEKENDEKFSTKSFDLKDFNKRVSENKKIRKYIEIKTDFQLDGQNSKYKTNLRGLDRINDFAFKIEGGYLEKSFVSYQFTMERPDRIYRNDSNRNSSYNLRKHDFEMKYSFGDEDKPWWIGSKVQYVQNGAPKISDPEIYESSNMSTKVNRITLGLITLSHRAENLEWEIGGGMKWDKPNNKKLGYYPVVSLKFGITPFPDKSLEAGYTKGRVKFGTGL